MTTDDQLQKLVKTPIVLPLARGEEYRIVEPDYSTTPTPVLAIMDKQKTEQALIRHPEWDSGEIDYMITAINLAPAIAAELIEARAKIEALQTALALVLDHVDYTKGACGMTELVGGVLPKQIIDRAHDAMKGR